MNREAHPLLRRQLARHFAKGDADLLLRLRPFMDAVSDAYAAADRDRTLLERSLEISSAELTEANDALQAVFLASPDLHIWTSAEGVVRKSQVGDAGGPGRLHDIERGERIQDLQNGVVREALESALAQVRATGKPSSVDYSLSDADGDAVFEACVLPLPGDERVVVVRDITARTRAEEDRFRLLADHVEEVLWLAVPGRTSFIYVNPAFERVWGTSREDLYANADVFLEGIHEEDRDRVQRATTGGAHDLEYRVVRVDGTVRWVRDRAFPIRDASGRLDRVSGIISDITDQKVVNEELAAEVRESRRQLRVAQKMEAVGRLAAGIAHDFNNLLSVVLSCGELLLDGIPSGDERRDDVEQILAAGRRGEALTRRVLSFSRQEVVEPQVLDVNRVVHELEGMLGALLRDDVRLGLDLCETRPFVRMDRSQLEQVVINLAINARDAMPRGGRLRIITRIEEETSSTRGLAPISSVILEVHDTGVGMPPEVVARCFEPFFSTKPEGRGTGLGLATVADILRKAGGSVSVESALHRGTRIRIVLPSCRATEAVLEAEGKVVAPLGDVTGRILLVEDEKPVRRVAERILRSAGYLVHTAAGGPEALALWQTLEIPADLLLTDIVMPTIDGRELSRSLKRKWPELRVLYMSGYTDDDHLKSDVSSGAVRFLRKPFTPGQLLDAVRSALVGETTDVTRQ